MSVPKPCAPGPCASIFPCLDLPRVVASLTEIRRKRSTQGQARSTVIAQEMLAVVQVAQALYSVSGEVTQSPGHDQECWQMTSHRHSQLSDHDTLITSCNSISAKCNRCLWSLQQAEASLGEWGEGAAN